jgi:anti-sigma regulatory factor (Ser/Thr protein kinase)
MEATLTLADPSGVADARRQALQMARSLELPEKRHADAALVVTELATNILKYAGQGEILLRSFLGDTATGLEIIALDKGPGIANVEMAQADGYSTGGSLGAGLGTVARHSDVFEIYSLPGNGTAILSRIEALPPRVESRFAMGVRSTPKKGQEICGDAWAIRRIGDTFWVTLLDGLGHGPLAAEASRKAVETFQAAKITDSPEDILRQAHLDIKASRGTVMAVATLDAPAAIASFAGVGNIVAIIDVGSQVDHLLSTDGTVGYNMRTIRPSQSVWRPGRVFIATTDGLSTRWNLSRHPGLTQKHPSLIAAVLHRDFARDADDATIIVVKAL